MRSVSLSLQQLFPHVFSVPWHWHSDLPVLSVTSRLTWTGSHCDRGNPDSCNKLTQLLWTACVLFQQLQKPTDSGSHCINSTNGGSHHVETDRVPSQLVSTWSTVYLQKKSCTVSAQHPARQAGGMFKCISPFSPPYITRYPHCLHTSVPCTLVKRTGYIDELRSVVLVQLYLLKFIHPACTIPLPEPVNHWLKVVRSLPMPLFPLNTISHLANINTGQAMIIHCLRELYSSHGSFLIDEIFGESFRPVLAQTQDSKSFHVTYTCVFEEADER